MLRIGLYTFAAATAAYVLLRTFLGRLRRNQARERLYDEELDEIDEGEAGSVRRWLFVAGYRDPSAPATFWTLQVLFLVLGLAVATLISTSGLGELAKQATAEVPGGIGGAVQPVLDVSGALIVLLLGALPLLWVRRARRRRVDAIERDLPVSLELMASLARSGLGFDAAVGRILEAERATELRPLGEEFSGYRSDVLSGLPREDSFRRLAERASVPGLDVFVAAMTHSERLGVGLSDTLRRQADELWNQRRERALAKAQTLPARLAGPLIACFLPGLLLVSLGPALVRFWETISGITEGLD